MRVKCLVAYADHMRIQSAVRSNVFFLIPLGMALWYGLFLHSVLILWVMIFSTLFHLSVKKKFKIMDNLFAYLLIASNLYLLYLSHFQEPYFVLALLFVVIWFYFLFKKKKDDYEWHISSTIISILCILAYVM